MPWPVYGQMTDEDLRAIYAYLRQIPPIRNQVPEPLVPVRVSASVKAPRRPSRASSLANTRA